MNYIHKEGRKEVAGLFIILLIIDLLLMKFLLHNLALRIAAAAVLLTVFLAISSFFRNPTRQVVADANSVLSPCDGKVVVIEEVDEPEYFKDKRLQISVFMSPANVHVNRCAIGGEVKYVKYHAGKYLVAWHPKSSTENERNTVVLSNGKTEILLRQIAGALAKRIICYVKPGDKVQHGADFGFIKFGSRVDIFLPIGTKVDVALNQVVKGNQTVIAKIA
jgi:phosphatidylserine decarboxylase